MAIRSTALLLALALAAGCGSANSFAPDSGSTGGQLAADDELYLVT
jgi:hypothetical protein